MPGVPAENVEVWIPRKKLSAVGKEAGEVPVTYFGEHNFTAVCVQEQVIKNNPAKQHQERCNKCQESGDAIYRVFCKHHYHKCALVSV